MSYLSRIRALVGNEPILCVAAGAIVHKGRQILLQKRTENDTWAIHGGSMELGETVEETVKRELQEEIGIIPTRLRFYKVFSGEDMHFKYTNGSEIYCVNVIFLCDEYEGELRQDGKEVTGLQWFDIGDLPENINAPVDKAILKDIDKALLPDSH